MNNFQVTVIIDREDITSLNITDEQVKIELSIDSELFVSNDSGPIYPRWCSDKMFSLGGLRKIIKNAINKYCNENKS